MKPSMRASFAALVVLCLSACNPDFVMPWEVKIPRVMGARVEVEGDTTRSRPKPGETFRVRQFLSTPRRPETSFRERYDARLEVCFGLLLSDGTLACAPIDGQSSIAFPGTITNVSDEELVFDDLFVPSELTGLETPFGTLDRIALFGAVCVDGKAEHVEGTDVNEDPLTEVFRCTDNDGAEFTDPLLFTLSVDLDLGRPQDDAHQPSFACEAAEDSTDACRAGVSVTGEEQRPGEFVLVLPKQEDARDLPRETVAWLPRENADDPDSVPWDDCADSGLPVVRLGDKEHNIRLRFDGKDRESYSYETTEDDKLVVKSTREELIVSHALTDLGGEIERYFSVIENDVADDRAELEFTYQPPGPEGKPAEGLTEAGRLVRFYFVLGDERGGVDYTTRELCLLPKGP